MTEPAPAPPPGPGVVPPFAAPPVEGRNSRLWVGLGIGGAFALLCCGGGIAALIALTVASGEAFNEQARVVIGDYLDAVEKREYGDAYDMLCEREQQAESRSQFEARVATEPRISSYQVGEFNTASGDYRRAGRRHLRRRWHRHPAGQPRPEQRHRPVRGLRGRGVISGAAARPVTVRLVVALCLCSFSVVPADRQPA